MTILIIVSAAIVYINIAFALIKAAEKWLDPRNIEGESEEVAQFFLCAFWPLAFPAILIIWPLIKIVFKPGLWLGNGGPTKYLQKRKTRKELPKAVALPSKD